MLTRCCILPSSAVLYCGCSNSLFLCWGILTNNPDEACGVVDEESTQRPPQHTLSNFIRSIQIPYTIYICISTNTNTNIGVFPQQPFLIPISSLYLPPVTDSARVVIGLAVVALSLSWTAFRAASGSQKTFGNGQEGGRDSVVELGNVRTCHGRHGGGWYVFILSLDPVAYYGRSGPHGTHASTPGDLDHS